MNNKKCIGGLYDFMKRNNSYMMYENNPNLTSITINKPCNIIKNNLENFNNNYYYPFLSDEYNNYNIGNYASGTTVYGSNNEICDEF